MLAATAKNRGSSVVAVVLFVFYTADEKWALFSVAKIVTEDEDTKWIILQRV